tara:strand:- start:1697 stop:5191 length:3495 start_codon:yes stop_codon:yes gene_type:complete
MSDTEKEVFSIAQAASAAAVAVAYLPAGFALRPQAFNKSINTEYPAVGGLQFQKKLQNFEQHVNLYYPPKNSDYSGADVNAALAGIPDAASRKFNQRMKLELPRTNIRLYLETITPKLLETDVDYGGFQNHIMVRIETDSDPNYEYPPGVEDLPDDNPIKQWYTSRFTPIFGEDEKLYFSYKYPMEDVPVIPYSINAPNGEIAYSPQARVFSNLIKEGLGDTWPGGFYGAEAQEELAEINNKLESTLHSYAMRDFMEKLGVAASKSSFFKTYTYEEIKSKVHGLKFHHLEASDPYSDFGGPFKAKYGANDTNNRTEVYYEPRAAINDTPLRKKALDIIMVEDMKKKIKDSWDWSEAYDPEDPDSLSPLSVAVIDGLVEELIKVYCVEALIKTAPADSAFDTSKNPEIRDHMFSVVLSKTIINDINETFPFFDDPESDEEPDTFRNDLYKYIDSYMQRKYLNAGKSIFDAPTGEDAIAEMINGVDEPGLLHSAAQTAKLGTTIYHLQPLPSEANLDDIPGAGQDLDIPDPLDYIVVPNPTPDLDSAPSIAPPMKTFHLAEILETPDNGIPKTAKRLTKSGTGDLSNGGFIYERYIRIQFHEDTKDWFETFESGDNGFPGLYDRLQGPISLAGAQDIDIGNTAPTDATTDFTRLITTLYSYMADPQFNEIWKTGAHKEAYDRINSATSIAGPTGIFAGLTHHVRLSYVMTSDTEAEVQEVKQAFANLIEKVVPIQNFTGDDQFRKAIAREKSFMLDEEGTNVIILPLAESPGNTLAAVEDASGVTSDFLISSAPFGTPISFLGILIPSLNDLALFVEAQVIPASAIPIVHLRYLMQPISVDTPNGDKYFKAFFYGHPKGTWTPDHNGQEQFWDGESYNISPNSDLVHYLVPYNTPDGKKDLWNPNTDGPLADFIANSGEVKSISASSKAWQSVFPQEVLDSGAAPRFYQVKFGDLPEQHQEALLEKWFEEHPEWPTDDGVGGATSFTLSHKQYPFTDWDYTINYPESIGKPDGIDTFEAFMGADASLENKISDIFKDTSQWKMLFNYAMPLALATNMISLYTLLGVMETPATRRSFGKVKKAFKFSIQASACKSDESGKCPKGFNPADFAAFVSDDGPPDYEIPPPEDKSGTPGDNLALLSENNELTDEQVEAINSGMDKDGVDKL